MDFSKCPEHILSLAPDELLLLLKKKITEEPNPETKFLLKAAANQVCMQIFSKSEVVKLIPVENCELKQDKSNNVIVTKNARAVIEKLKDNLSHTLFLMIQNWCAIAKIKKHKGVSKGLTVILNLLCQITESLRKIINTGSEKFVPTVKFQLACYLVFKKSSR